MRVPVLVLGLVVTVSGSSVSAEIARTLRGEQLREAIAFGQNSPAELDQYDLLRERTYVVNFDTPFLRVAQLAHAMKAQNAGLAESDVSPKVTAEVLNLYVHAKHETGDTQSLGEVEQVVISRPRPGLPPQIVTPTSFQTFVRRVPVADDYDGPTRLAKSVKAVFPLDALSAGVEVRIRFQGGATQVVKVQPERMAQFR
jgi:hypothetical protein